jgi:hypothetical protein
MKLIVAYAIGIVFGLGISISGMANPAKVLNFFDVAGRWDPSLAFVMSGALLVAFLGFRVVLRGNAPALADSFQLPSARHLDAPLLGGSAVFGIGWGIAGFCPGGALPALGTGVPEVFIFIASASVGILAARLGPRMFNGRRAAA